MVLPRRKITALLILLLIFLWLTFSEGPWRSGLSAIFPSLETVLYPISSFPRLVGEHILLVLTGSAMASILGLFMGVLVTRPWGRDFLPSVSALASMGQTFPPVAVLAIAVPAVGFGFRPTVIALFLYGLLPVLRNTIAGIESVAPDILEASTGMGMTPLQTLKSVELPLAAPIIMAGVRVSTVINIGTAALGATIGAGGLGKPIIAGLIGENPAFILEGAILVGLMAVIADNVLGLFAGVEVETVP